MRILLWAEFQKLRRSNTVSYTHLEMTALQYSTYNRSLLPALKQQGLRIITYHEDLTEEEGKFVDKYFMENVYPVLTPMAVDSSRPFPLIRNKTLNLSLIHICPLSGVSKPPRIRRVVVFPQPLGPNKVRNSFSRIYRFRSSSTISLSNVFVIPCKSINL